MKLETALLVASSGAVAQAQLQYGVSYTPTIKNQPLYCDANTFSVSDADAALYADMEVPVDADGRIELGGGRCALKYGFSNNPYSISLADPSNPSRTGPVYNSDKFCIKGSDSKYWRKSRKNNVRNIMGVPNCINEAEGVWFNQYTDGNKYMFKNDALDEGIKLSGNNLVLSSSGNKMVHLAVGGGNGGSERIRYNTYYTPTYQGMKLYCQLQSNFKPDDDLYSGDYDEAAAVTGGAPDMRVEENAQKCVLRAGSDRGAYRIRFVDPYNQDSTGEVASGDRFCVGAADGLYWRRSKRDNNKKILGKTKCNGNDIYTLWEFDFAGSNIDTTNAVFLLADKLNSGLFVNNGFVEYRDGAREGFYLTKDNGNGGGECPTNKYGPNCRYTVTCVTNNGVCNLGCYGRSGNGQCSSCYQGYSGENCEKREELVYNQYYEPSTLYNGQYRYLACDGNDNMKQEDEDEYAEIEAQETAAPTSSDFRYPPGASEEDARPPSGSRCRVSTRNYPTGYQVKLVKKDDENYVGPVKMNDEFCIKDNDAGFYWLEGRRDNTLLMAIPYCTSPNGVWTISQDTMYSYSPEFRNQNNKGLRITSSISVSQQYSDTLMMKPSDGPVTPAPTYPTMAPTRNPVFGGGQNECKVIGKGYCRTTQGTSGSPYMACDGRDCTFSYQQCYDACQDYNGCVGIEHNINSGKCEVHTEALADYVANSPGTTCYDCSSSNGGGGSEKFCSLLGRGFCRDSNNGGGDADVLCSGGSKCQTWTRQKCENRCMRDDSCVGFEYGINNNRCEVHFETPYRANGDRDYQCYTCTYTRNRVSSVVAQPLGDAPSTATSTGVAVGAGIGSACLVLGAAAAVTMRKRQKSAKLDEVLEAHRVSSKELSSPNQEL